MERNKELRETVKSALIYPTILIGVAVAVGDGAAGLGRAAVRADVRAGGQGAAAADAGRDLRRHGSCKHWWWALRGARRARRLRGSAAGWRNPAVRLRWDARLLRAAAPRRPRRKVEVARFARTLATLLGNGVTLLAGLSIVKETMATRVLARRARRRDRAAARRQGLRPAARRDRPLSAARHRR